jgi:hypothetical protein
MPPQAAASGGSAQVGFAVPGSGFSMPGGYDQAVSGSSYNTYGAHQQQQQEACTQHLQNLSVQDSIFAVATSNAPLKHKYSAASGLSFEPGNLSNTTSGFSDCTVDQTPMQGALSMMPTNASVFTVESTGVGCNNATGVGGGPWQGPCASPGALAAEAGCNGGGFTDYGNSHMPYNPNQQQLQSPQGYGSLSGQYGQKAAVYGDRQQQQQSNGQGYDYSGWGQ